MNEIYVALKNHITTMAGYNKDQWAWENKNFSPPQGRWYQVYFTPVEPDQAGVGEGSQNRYRGLLIINVFGKLNLGDGDCGNAADTIIDHFSRGSLIEYTNTKVKIEKCYRIMGIAEDAHYKIPVHIRWRADI